MCGCSRIGVSIATDLRLGTEYFIIPNKGDPIPNIILRHPRNSLLATLLRDLDRLDPALKIILARQLKHRQHLGPVANMRGPDVAAVGHKVERLQLGQRLVRQADIVEDAVDLEDGEVGRHVELVGRVGAVDDEVQGELVGLVPLLVLGADELVRAEGEGFILLLGRVGDGVDSSAEGARPDYGEMAETASDRRIKMELSANDTLAKMNDPVRLGSKRQDLRLVKDSLHSDYADFLSRSTT